MDEGNWVGEGMGRKWEMSKRNLVRGEPEGKSTGRESWNLCGGVDLWDELET